MAFVAENPVEWALHYWPVLAFVGAAIFGSIAWVWRRELTNWLFRVEVKVKEAAAEAAQEATSKAIEAHTEKTLEVLHTKTDELVKLVDDKTREIQPHKNGGYSLSDANEKINLVVEMIRDLKESNRENFEDLRSRVSNIEQSQLTHLQKHAEDHDTP